MALAPSDLFALFSTHWNKAYFQVFLQEFEQHLASKGVEGKILLLGDGATAHPSQKWEQLKQMDWIRQPTACPEVNPVERFFQELLLKIEPAKENIKQLTLFLYIKNAIFNSF